MDRRSFLKSTGVYVTGSMLAECGMAKTLSAPAESSGGRLIFPLNQNWLYSVAAPVGADEQSFDDSAFERVVLPHNTVPTSWHNFDQRAYQVVSQYRRHFRLPDDIGDRHVFIDFEGVMTATTVWLNGNKIGKYEGGYTPFSFELTPYLNRESENVLAVEVDSRELPGVPPFGYQIDYLTFGGIYRDVALRVVPSTHIENVFAHGVDVLSHAPGLDVEVSLQSLAALKESLALEVTLKDGDAVLGRRIQKFTSAVGGQKLLQQTVQLRDFGVVNLWDVDRPYLYTVETRLLERARVVDHYICKTGFRTARFTDRGFELNGKIMKLRGLNRHQTFPYAGAAMPARVLRKDVEILKRELKCNMVRCSHYPQSRHFLDACDELGLLVLDEIPGWQHVGDQAWQDKAIDNVSRMIRRDWNHPSIILWSIRINESHDFHDFYVRTNALARKLDPTRQTIGVRYFQESEFLEDVFGINDFGFPLKAPNHPLYLNTEFVGAEFPTRPWDDNDRHREHILRFAHVYDQLASDAQYAGGLGWCAFDYATHADFGGGDHICYHGVMDIFRLPKPAAGFYKSQCDPSEEAVLEAGFHWAENDQPSGFKRGVICSNCELLKCYIKRDGKWHQIIELKPAHDEFPHLTYPPFFLSLPDGNDDWGDLRIDGYIQGNKIASKSLSGLGIDQKFSIHCDDTELFADGADAARIVLCVTDEYGAIRPLCNDPISISLDGPATLIGPKSLALVGGTAAVWVRARQEEGSVRLTAAHPQFGVQTIQIKLSAVPAERV
ncbi:MAG TPA: glycoside hydrolase family 2 TIM barrel-domain containing protein [Pseudacidobacterium sp.]|nr:glycoside hydrolase family 2 TIM barrel-domain containing protein [Pseudacidobacterium sp.]